MKDEHDKSTGDLLPGQTADGGAAAVAAVRPSAGGSVEGKPKRLPRRFPPPEGVRPLNPGLLVGFGQSVVPVSSVARDMGISARRVRVMLAEGRLAGQRLVAPPASDSVLSEDGGQPEFSVFVALGPDCRHDLRALCFCKNVGHRRRLSVLV